MPTTYVYLSEDELKRLAGGEKIEVEMTVGLRNSNRLFLQLDQEKKNSYEESPWYQENLKAIKKIMEKLDMCHEDKE